MHIENFMFLERAEMVDLKNREASYRTTVPSRHQIFAGHFPDYPVFPGALLQEITAQGAGLLLQMILGFKKSCLLSAVNSAKFRKAVFPGTQLKVACKVVRLGSSFSSCNSRITDADSGNLLAETKLSFALIKESEGRSNSAYAETYARDIGMFERQETERSRAIDRVM